MNLPQQVTVTVVNPTLVESQRIGGNLVSLRLGKHNGAVSLVTDDAGLDQLITDMIAARDNLSIVLAGVQPVLAVVK